ncbi:cAMP-binding domain of CRP or a regulatory subunit of cAMP-dependent protein kinases [Cruoricaptor ignavus]|uniref:Crp/Fnr family transcriptional regulator n=1 Tax=Cruoricaptor ignavus TaxID=1118202 RepID=A0A1M6APW0_9FLAO|nr:Crp/Fnr family transcriptional regulator [Cruoricaptor ignavus]QOR73048.1 Crp/Fnr family transcriptional regulator [Cruoricaptor ignavus]SHI38502.1 cAMP-binding domain of CRP or a regulatory subunit of cAMP-dependent protein kinases [Cruoricaptor ignavus]
MSLQQQQTIEKNLREAFDFERLRTSLDQETYDLASNSLKEKTYKKGECIFDDGEFPKGVYFITKGTIKLSKSGTFGKDQILRFIKEGDLVGYRSILSGEDFQARAEAMNDVSATFVPAAVFLKLLEEDPKISYAMLQKIAYELGESSKTITFLAQKTVRERLAEVLLLLEHKLGADQEGYIKISLTREEIANLVGTATESAIRLISEFKSDKLIQTDGRKIKIINHEKLRKLAHVQ